METGVWRDAARSGPKAQGDREGEREAKNLVADLVLDNMILREAAGTSESITGTKGGEMGLRKPSDPSLAPSVYCQ